MMRAGEKEKEKETGEKGPERREEASIAQRQPQTLGGTGKSDVR